MVSAILSLLRGTGLSGYRDVLPHKYIFRDAVRNDLPQSPVHRAPGILADAEPVQKLRFHLLDRISGGGLDSVDDGEPEEKAPVCDRRDIAGQLRIIEGMVTLSHRGTLRVVVGNPGLRLIELKPCLSVQAEEARILLDPAHAEVGVVVPRAVRRKPVPEIREEEVAGILDAVHERLISVVRGVDPAADIRCHEIILSGTVDHRGKIYDLLLQGRDRCDRLKGGAGRKLCLRRAVEKRQGEVLIALLQVFRIGDPVIVKAGIGDERPDLSRPHIRHDDGAVAGVQSQLRRSDLQPFDLVDQKAVGKVRISRRKLLIGRVVLREHSLLEHRHQKEISGDPPVRDGVFIEELVKVRVLPEMLRNLFRKKGEDALRVGILRRELEL